MTTTKLEPESIPKASELRRWIPHKIVSSVDKEKDICYLELPGYSPCRILDHVVNLNEKDVSTELRRFVYKLRRGGSFSTLCMLATLDEVLHHKDREFWDALEKQSQYPYHKNSNTLQDDSSLLVEAWPLIQQEISWNAFLIVHQRIESRLCMVTLYHPLGEYAKQTLFQIDDFEKAVEIACRRKWIPRPSKNRLQVSQLFLDYVASLPPRVVGVLLEDPTSESNLSPIPQSCLPLACLELSLKNESDQLICQMISLYQLQPNEVYTVSTRPPAENCSCFKCRYEQGCSDSERVPTRNWVLMAQRLAHVYFQQENYEDAKALYRKCYSYFEANNRDEVKAADLWHSIAAVYLTELKFLRAQRHWKEGSRFQSSHTGIALQLEKQASYGYFDPIANDSKLKNLPDYQAIGTSQRLFIAPNAVSSSTCRQLITWAKEYAFKRGGWSTSRHYAVPTNDIPVHLAPKLLNWFVQWFRDDVTPLLQAQFQTNQQFYVHDAFLVRYSACSSSHFLPLHYDESTHSLILELNSDFEGGGTYFYSLDHTSTPSCGSLASFRGNQLLHGGNVVTKGERYILAIFLYVDSDKDRKGNKSKHTESSRQPSKRLKTEDEFTFGFF
jgi:tetratricopeptide (TPR) repeat protein